MWPLISSLVIMISAVGISAALALNSSHVLSALILMEYLVILIYTQVMLIIFNQASSADVILVLFVVSVAGVAVGLGLLVSVSRMHGQDYLSLFNLLW